MTTLNYIKCELFNTLFYNVIKYFLTALIHNFSLFKFQRVVSIFEGTWSMVAKQYVFSNALKKSTLILFFYTFSFKTLFIFAKIHNKKTV